MSTTTKVCYRDRDNGVYFGKQQHRHDCADPGCRGCVPCGERHCMKAKNCAWHIGEGELTCGRCIADVRRDLRKIDDLSPLMMTVALGAGVDSEAANLAGPGADYGVFSARRAIDKRWIFEHLPASQSERAIRNLIPDDDEHHPYAVTTRWEAMIREDYEHEGEGRTSVSEAVAYLDRNLHRIANDDEQDFPLLARELRKCRQHLEAVLQNDDRPERGAPCPECANDRRAEVEAAEKDGREVKKKPLPRLARIYPHWCEDTDCERLHDADDSKDVWQCPRVIEHRWSHEDYSRWIEDRRKSA